MKIIFLGAPGAGKGTQAEIISKRLGLPSVSTGDIIRAALRNGTEMGLKAKKYTESGKLVPDEVVIGIIKERLAQDDCAPGFILDGFPRTIPQAEALSKMGIEIDRVVSLEVPDSEVEARMTGRRVCPGCGASYHLLFKKPAKDGICDGCGEQLIQRKDDAAETVKERLRVYHEQTEPLKDFYNKRGALKIVEGTGSVDSITKLILEALES